MPSLIRSFGAQAVGAAVAFSGKPRVFQRLAKIVHDSENIKQVLENAPPYAPDAPPATATLATATLEPEPDSPAAHFWRDEARRFRQLLEEVHQSLKEAIGMADELELTKARKNTAESEIDALKKREKQNAARLGQKLEKVEAKWKLKVEELEKTAARGERRLRAALAQIEELEHENKKQKKQLRQGAQIREDERKKLALLEARLEELAPTNAENAPDKRAMDAVSSPPTTQKAPNQPVVVARPSPLDEIFEWMADGRRVRVTAREVRRLIDKNDEDRVADIMLALEALQGSNPDLRKRFLERLKQAGPHYPRVLTHRTTRVLVDASNVARFCPNRYGKGRLSHLLSMRSELQRLDCWPIVLIADASLPYFIDQPNELREMAHQGELQLVDKGVEADEVLAREARKTGAYVVTNDAKFFYKVSPDYEPPRISFRVHDDLVIVDEF